MSDIQIPPDTESDKGSAPENAPDALLSNIECRVLGALMEKQLATPDNYPLTVNSLISAANQKSSREPVSSYQQGEIVKTLRDLESRRFVRYEMGARSERYEQRFTHELSFSKKQQALLTVMMLRGPQTINELQTRTQRLHEFTDRDDLLVSLERLTQGDNPSVVVIPRQSGQRDDRYAHCLCGEVQIPAASTRAPATSSESSESEISQLRAEVQSLRKQIETLYELTGHTPDQSQTNPES
jgi:uncharacterized protein YceH (UPF0502 family)